MRRGASLYAAAARDRGAGDDVGRFGFPTWCREVTEGTDDDARRRHDLVELARKATRWRRRPPQPASPKSARVDEVRCQWDGDQLNALAAQLHLPPEDVVAAFDAGHADALQGAT